MNEEMSEYMLARYLRTTTDRLDEMAEEDFLKTEWISKLESKEQK